MKLTSKFMKTAVKLPQMHSMQIEGLDLVIEWPVGSTRTGVNDKGERWKREMKNSYGYLRDTKTVDDHEDFDVYLGDDEDAEYAYIVEQLDDEGQLDEHKGMLFFPDLESAREAYLANMPNGWEDHLGEIAEMPYDELVKMVKGHHEPEAKTASEDGNIPTLEEVLQTMDEDGSDPRAVESAQKVYEEVVGVLSKLPLTIYRAIRLKDISRLRADTNIDDEDEDANWEGDGGGFGVYWAWNEQGAKAYNTKADNGSQIFIFCGQLTSPNDIDWESTLYRNITTPDEYEVTLQQGTPIAITGWKVKGEPQWRAPEPNFKTVFASTDSEPVVKSGEHISLEELRQKGIADDSHCKKMNDANEKTASVGEIYSGALMSPEVQSLYHQAGQGHNRSVCNECKTAAYPLLSEARVFFEREHMYQSKVDRYAALAKAMQVPNTKDPQLLALCQDVVNTKTLYDEAARLVPEVRRTYWDRDEYRQYLKELHNLKQWKKHRQALTTLKKYVDDKVTETRNKRDVNDSIDLRKRPDRSPDYSVSLPTSKRLPNMDEQEEKMGWEEADFGDEKFSSRHMAKPKCPHCGSTKYALMPTDFETAKCDDCGKNWEMGLVKGVNASFEVEAAQDYEAMFKSLLADLKTNKNSVHDHDRTDAAIRANIHWAKETLKKKDRIVWYLRLFRYSLVDNYVGGLLGQHMECDNWIKWLATERAKLGLTPDGVIPRILQQRLEHFMSLPIPEIQSMVFTNYDNEEKWQVKVDEPNYGWSGWDEDACRARIEEEFYIPEPEPEPEPEKKKKVKQKASMNPWEVFANVQAKFAKKRIK